MNGKLNCFEQKHTYRFEYDGLSRLVAARHSDSDGHNGLFDTSYTYDLNGNITTLTRSGLYDYAPPYVKRYGSIDDLTYEYSGNQVTRISDVCTGPFYQGAYHFR
ncbi:MAG: hypothetical protein K2H74_05575, partial [Paramuribaculum sp.]|nr:hypothetical protein [Paramuribaculum sp.]